MKKKKRKKIRGLVVFVINEKKKKKIRGPVVFVINEGNKKKKKLEGPSCL